MVQLKKGFRINLAQFEFKTVCQKEWCRWIGLELISTNWCSDSRLFLATTVDNWWTFSACKVSTQHFRIQFSRCSITDSVEIIDPTVGSRPLLFQPTAFRSKSAEKETPISWHLWTHFNQCNLIKPKSTNDSFAGESNLAKSWTILLCMSLCLCVCVCWMLWVCSVYWNQWSINHKQTIESETNRKQKKILENYIISHWFGRWREIEFRQYHSQNENQRG